MRGVEGPPSGWPPRLREAFEERAAIMQFHGGMTREHAEKRAANWIRKLVRGMDARLV